MAKLNCIHILFSFIQKSFLKQSIANSIFQFIDDWIRIGVLLCWKRLLYQQSHNLWQSTATAHTHYLLFQYQLNSSQRAISKQFNRIRFGPSLHQNNKSISHEKRVQHVDNYKLKKQKMRICNCHKNLYQKHNYIQTKIDLNLIKS